MGCRGAESRASDGSPASPTLGFYPLPKPPILTAGVLARTRTRASPYCGNPSNTRSECFCTDMLPHSQQFPAGWVEKIMKSVNLAPAGRISGDGYQEGWHSAENVLLMVFD